MAVLDFPNSPTVGQQYPAPNGATYQWDGTAWVVTGGPPSVPTGPAGGDLAGAYPNPTVTPAAKSKWQIAGATLMPLDNTKAVALLPFGTAKLRLQAHNTVTGGGIFENRDWINGNVQDDATLPSWGAVLRSDLDMFNVQRQPAGSSSPANLLTLDATGKLTIPSHIQLGPTALFSTLWAAANVFEPQINKPFSAQDTTKAGWAVSHYIDSNDKISWWHRKAGDAANAGAEFMRLDTGGNLSLLVASPYIVFSSGPISASLSFASQRYLNLDWNAPWGPQVPGTQSWQMTLDGVGDFWGLWRRAPNAAAGTVTQPIKVDAYGNVWAAGYCIPRSRGCIAQLAAQTITTGNSDQTITFSGGVTDSAGMINYTYNQIIATDTSQLILFTANVTQGASNGRLGIQQWNGSAWVTRASSSTPVAGQVAAITTVAVICDSRYGAQFQVTYANAGGSNFTLAQPGYVCAAVLGKTP